MNTRRWMAGAAALAFAGAGAFLPGSPAEAQEDTGPDGDHEGIDHEGHEGMDHDGDHEGHDGDHKAHKKEHKKAHKKHHKGGDHGDHEGHEHDEDHEAPVG